MASRGDIVLVDYPFAEGVGSRVRPALIVQADDLNRTLQSTVLAMITSSQRRKVGHASQLLIDQAHSDFSQSGLRLDSIVQCNMLATLKQDLILRTIGALSAATMRDVDACLRAALGIP